MDKEQLQLGSSDKFWKLITTRRSQRTMSRTALEQRVKEKKSRNGKQSRQTNTKRISHWGPRTPEELRNWCVCEITEVTDSIRNDTSVHPDSWRPRRRVATGGFLKASVPTALTRHGRWKAP